MIKLAEFLIRLIAMVIFVAILGGLELLALILWDDRFFDIADEIWKYIWKRKNEKQ